MKPDELAKYYATCFLSDAGKIVLADLLAKFPPGRVRYDRAKPPCAITAAIRDGESGVMQEIKEAISRGAPLLGVNPEPNQQP